MNKDSMLSVSVNDGKYTVVLEADGKLHALRYGEVWRDLVGDNLVYSLAYELDEERSKNAQLEAEIERLKNELQNSGIQNSY